MREGERGSESKEENWVKKKWEGLARVCDVKEGKEEDGWVPLGLI